MAQIPTNGIPPLAGLATYAEAARPGYGVDDNVDLMRRYNYVESRLYEAGAAFMNPTPEWEVKCALSHHLYLDSEHSLALRERVAELRRPPLLLDKCPDQALEDLMEELLRSQTTIEKVVGIYGVIRPMLLAAYKHHAETINPLFDQPTARMLRTIIYEQTQMVEWGQEAIAAIVQTECQKAESAQWQVHLNAFLKAAGGINGFGEKSDCVRPQKRATAPFIPDIDPQRDWRSGEIYNFAYRANDVYLDADAADDERVAALMFKRFHEMDVPEMMSSILIQTKGKPWPYYRDMARQLWDEARHAMMGEVWFAKIGLDWSKYPNHVGWSMHLNLDREPLERHIILYFIEQNLMDGKTGKRLEWQIAKASNDPLATYFQDYDWADEVLHAQIGRRWLKPDVGDVKQLLAAGAEIAGRASPSIDARTKLTPQLDWWPEFALAATGHESTSQAGSKNRLIPTFKELSSG